MVFTGDRMLWRPVDLTHVGCSPGPSRCTSSAHALDRPPSLQTIPGLMMIVQAYAACDIHDPEMLPWLQERILHPSVFSAVTGADIAGICSAFATLGAPGGDGRGGRVAPPPPPPGMHWKGGGVPTFPPSRAPSLCPATVSLTPSARLNGICNRQ